MKYVVSLFIVFTLLTASAYGDSCRVVTDWDSLMFQGWGCPSWGDAYTGIPWPQFCEDPESWRELTGGMYQVCYGEGYIASSSGYCIYEPDADCDGIQDDLDMCPDTADQPVGSDGCPVIEICNDGIDNEGDDKIDCGDSDCSFSPYCTPVDNCLEVPEN